MFDVTDVDSFINIEYWLKEINKYVLSDKIPIILIGNKSDLKNVKIKIKSV